MYAFVLYSGFKSWISNQILTSTRVILYLQSVSFNILSLSYSFHGIIELIVYTRLKEFIEFGFEFDTGISYGLVLYNKVYEFSIGLNLIALFFLLIIYVSEKNKSE